MSERPLITYSEREGVCMACRKPTRRCGTVGYVCEECAGVTASFSPELQQKIDECRKMGEELLLLASQIQRNNEPVGDFRRVLSLLGSIFFYGHFKVETMNEHELVQIMKKYGYFFETEEQLRKKLHSED